MQDRPLQTKIIYGPVTSRRLGRSLGVNLLPTEQKVCSFDCLYCQYGFTEVYKVRRDAEGLRLPIPMEVAEALMDALPAAGPLDSITLAGNGEPTLHPHFRQIAEVVVRQRDMHKKGVPVSILSNSSTAEQMDVRLALARIDRRIMKLDSGTQATFEKINRPPPGTLLKRIVEALVQLKAVEIQALFIEGALSNSTPAEIEAWCGHLAQIKPVAVQVYTFDRQPADNTIRQVGRERLEQIAASARQAAPGADVKVY